LKPRPSQRYLTYPEECYETLRLEPVLEDRAADPRPGLMAAAVSKVEVA
jgi:hypothetical protein